MLRGRRAAENGECASSWASSWASSCGTSGRVGYQRAQRCHIVKRLPVSSPSLIAGALRKKWPTSDAQFWLVVCVIVEMVVARSLAETATYCYSRCRTLSSRCATSEQPLCWGSYKVSVSHGDHKTRPYLMGGSLNLENGLFWIRYEMETRRVNDPELNCTGSWHIRLATPLDWSLDWNRDYASARHWSFHCVFSLLWHKQLKLETFHS